MRYINSTGVLLALLVSACGGDAGTLDLGDATGDTVTTGTQTTSTGTQVVDGAVSEVSASLHPEFGSMIYVDWTQAVAGETWVEYSFDEGEWHESPRRTLDVGASQQLLVGIPYELDVTYRVVVDTAAGQAASADALITTGTLPGIPRPTILAFEPDQWEPSGQYMMASINAQNGGWTGGQYWKFIVDRQGRVVWASETLGGRWTIYMHVSYDGKSILWDDSTYWSDWDGGAASKVHRMTLDGTILETFDTPGEHHVFTELADGSIVWGAAEGDSEALYKRTPDGEVEKIWDCDDFHDDVGVRDDCQSNTLYWHEETDTFLYSFYTTSTAVEIDHATGETLRQWGQMRRSWDFDPPDSVFQWQHGLTYTDAGTLLLSTEVPLGGWESETAAREYIVDDDTETLVEVWNYGLGRGVHGETAGEAHRLANGNTLHNYGSDGSVREVTDAGEIVWGLEWSGDKLMGRSVFLDDLYVLLPQD